MPLLLRKCSNSWLTNPGILSVTTVSGTPNLAKSGQRTSIAADEEVEEVQEALIHCNKAVCALERSGKSTWSLAHG